jgi:D-arabinose 1-dehydrogenase-like Zn-dependent alcohol dehydrogenase
VKLKKDTSMKAFILDRYGRADRVRAGDVPDPGPREDEALVQVNAAGVNLLDSKIRNGEFKLILPDRLPLVLGHDVAGVVLRVGSRVRRFKPGDEVYARPADGRIGAFAELIAIKEEDVAIKPKALSMEEAASVPLVGLTAWQALIEKSASQEGANSSYPRGLWWCGTFAIQLANHVGATVAATTSTANVDLVRRLGADIVIDYKKEDFAHLLRDCDVVCRAWTALANLSKIQQPGWSQTAIAIAWCRATTRTIWRGVFRIAISSSTPMPDTAGCSSTTRTSCPRRWSSLHDKPGRCSSSRTGAAGRGHYLRCGAQWLRACHRAEFARHVIGGSWRMDSTR